MCWSGEEGQPGVPGITNEEKYTMKYFTIAELCHSDTAITKGLDNTPNAEQTKNLERLIKVLDGLREGWGSAIRINSGFRNAETGVNAAVGGVATSAHTTGNAADLWPVNGKFEEFKKFVLSYLKDNNIKYDQCIIEKNSKGSQWIHFGLYNNSGQQRMESFPLNVK